VALTGMYKVVRTRNAGGDDDNVGILECSLCAIILGEVAGDLLDGRRRSVGVSQLVVVGLTARDEMWERSAATPGVLTTS
jgi:hypothetical protein